MGLNRRSFLRLATLTASALSTAACGSNLRIVNRTDAGLQGIGSLSGHERRVLDRLCYGVSVIEAQRVGEIGLEAWIEEQLAEYDLPEVDLRWRLRNLDVLDKDADAIDGAYGKDEVIEQLRSATLLQRVYSRRQLYEMIVEFWGDHFNISVEKGPGWALKVVDDRAVIRKHALGSFHELLLASARSPAMLFYLDNQANEKGAPNENYARELLELHTLGVDGGYSQHDVVELARCLTGWTVKEHFWRGRFQFDMTMHDTGIKNLFGMRVEPSGMAEVELVLNHLAKDQATARQLALKIMRRFVSDDPMRDAPDWVGKLEQVFMVTRGNIKALFRKLLLDGLARDPALMKSKFKRPVDFVVSALRITGAETDGGPVLHRFLNRMGQSLFAWPTPDGPPDDQVYWSSNLAPRWDFSFRLMAGLIDGSSPSDHLNVWTEARKSTADLIRSASENLLGYSLPEILIADLLHNIDHVDGLDVEEEMRAVFAGLLASPGFQYR
jgi:uncharacterized protein (DUF1800 family)